MHGERHADIDGVMPALAPSFEGDGGVRVAVAARSLRPFEGLDPLVCPI